MFNLHCSAQNNRMSTIKACIFDLDGVIVDTAVYHYKAWKRLARDGRHLGAPFYESFLARDFLLR